MVKITDPPDPEPEVTGVPGHVQKMISLFSSPDQITNGSEPSLTKSGRPSSGGSVTASKRTLVSQENISSSSPVCSPQSGTMVTGSTEALDSSYRSGSSEPESRQSCDSLDNIDGSVKSPSYLKLSCAVSGYNKYSAYNQTPKQTNRIQVLHTKDEHTSSTDSIDQENIIPNGGLDQVRVHQKVKVTSSQKPVPPKKPVPLQSAKRAANGLNHEHSMTNGAIITPSSGSHDNDVAVAKVTKHTDMDIVQNGVDVTDSSRLISNGQSSVVAGVASQGTEDILCTPKPAAAAAAADDSHSNTNSNDIPTPQKDGKYFLQVVQRETDRLQELCAQAEQDLNMDIPEEASGKLRAAIGKSNLLTTKKFKQFRGLCQKNMEQSEDDPFQTTAQDLAGFWDMVLIQVDEINAKFEEIDTLRCSGWVNKHMSNTNLKALANKSSGKHTGVHGKSGRTKTPGSTPKSSKNLEAAKQREEARRRLLQAKRAGRQRKVSQSDKEEVEIFVP